MLPLPVRNYFSHYAHLSGFMMLSNVLACLGLACMGAGFLIQTMVGRPWVIVAGGNATLAKPGTIADEAALEFASKWMLLRYGFTPETITLVQQQAKGLLHPDLHAAFEGLTQVERKQVREENISSLIAVHDALVTGHGAGPSLTVRVRAVRTLVLCQKDKGCQKLDPELVQPELTVVPYVVRGDVLGLGLSAIKDMPALSTRPKS